MTIKSVNSRSRLTNDEEPLRDKVALLFDGTNEGGRSLAVSLAKYGADVAIVYRQSNAEHANVTKKLVEAEGRNCLVIPSQIYDGNFTKKVVKRTVNTLGRLDILIDFSSLPSDDSGRPDASEDGKKYNDQRVPFANLEIISAAFDRMVDLNQTKTNDEEQNKGIERSTEKMRVAQELIHKSVISIIEGKEIGKVQDFYLDQDLTHVVAIYLGSEGLLTRKESLIKWPDVVTLGQDAILVNDVDCVMETTEVKEFENYIRRDEISSRPIDTPGGTKIGRIGDIVLDEEAQIAGFSLSQTYVSGPIAANRALSRSSVIDAGNEDGLMTANLSEAEKADFKVVYDGLFAEPSVSSTESAEVSAEVSS